MTLCIIDAQNEGDGDRSLTPELQAALTERLATVMETGSGPALYGEVMDLARRTAEQMSAEEQQALITYLHTLPEPSRTILTLRRRGMSPSQIATSMNLQSRAVCRSLAKLYSDMRAMFSWR